MWIQKLITHYFYSLFTPSFQIVNLATSKKATHQRVNAFLQCINRLKKILVFDYLLQRHIIKIVQSVKFKDNVCFPDKIMNDLQLAGSQMDPKEQVIQINMLFKSRKIMCDHKVFINKVKMGCPFVKPNGEKKYASQSQLNQSIEYFDERAFGSDLLKEIPQNEMQNRLHRHIVAIIWRMQGTVGRGTGLIISKDLVLTSAHNLYHNMMEVDRNLLEIYVSPRGTLKKPLRIQSTYVPNQYKTGAQRNNTYYDYALLKLEEKVNTSDFICLKPYSKQQFEKTNKMKVAVFGYPLCNYKSVGKYETKQAVTQSGIIKQDCIDSVIIERQQILHIVSTGVGHSGSPIIQMREDGLVVMGIHKGVKNVNAKNGEKTQFNTARLITKKLIQILERQAEALGGQMFKVYSQECVLDSQLKRQNPQTQLNQRSSIEEWMQRGDKLLRQSSFRNARQCYYKIIQMNPYHPQAYYNMGLTFEKDGYIDCARQAYKRAVKINPSYEKAQTSLIVLEK